ncbi:hypothetical protein [Serratia phage SP1]|nr:hypothetical protein [Serratia phage SP1]
MLFLDEKLIILQATVEKFWDKPWQDEFTQIMRENSHRVKGRLSLFRGMTHEDLQIVGYDIADGSVLNYPNAISFSTNMNTANDFAGMWCYETHTVHCLNADGARVCHLGRLAIDILMNADATLKHTLLARRPANKGWESYRDEQIDMLTREDEWIVLPEQRIKVLSTMVNEELSSNVIIFTEAVYNDNDVC